MMVILELFNERVITLEIKCKYKNEIAILRLTGELDMATVDSLVEKVLDIKENYLKIIFDFSGIKFVDSTGVGKMIKLFQDHDEINYVISNLQPDVKDIFDILNLKEILGESMFKECNEDALSYLLS
ncbi:MAG: hypothetical protein AWU54_1349 [Candidatus Frackibacter sp. T328-2]|nr:MAG: hypothetical protein AWU54_1349 [Candidatus Frackibacter sp. T328-2]